MSIQEIPTFCRICEPLCGVMATVEDGRIVKIRSDPEHVHSRGHFCKKAWGMVEVTYDRDRILYPMKRTGGPGEFTRISWEQAYTEIAERLRRVRAEHGAESFGSYLGNPPYFSPSAYIGVANFHAALDIRWKYSVNGEDGAAYQAALHILYGSGALWPKPDLWRTRFLIIAGGNPVVSHGSTISEPLVSEALKGIVDRGGRVIVIDPRRSETAQRFEHLPIQAAADPYFFAALLHELIAQGHVDAGFVEKHTRGFEALKAQLQSCTAEWAAVHCGISSATIRQLASDIGVARHHGGIAIHGRTGTCTQRFGTLTNLLMQMVPILTGSVDRVGGMSFGWSLSDPAAAVKGLGMGKNPSRTTGQPDIAGWLSSTSLASDILQPGAGQVRALIMTGANPVLTSAGSGPRLIEALQKLDLFFSLDLYINESNRYADYVLPAATMFERADMYGSISMLRPSVFATPALIKPQGEAKEEWEILDDLCRHMGLGGAQPTRLMRRLARMGIRITPHHFVDLMVRTSSIGDRFGLRPGGLSFKKLIRKHPHGLKIMDEMPTGILEQSILTDDKLIDLASPQLVSELARLHEDRSFDNAAYPMRMIGMREVLSHNSWMHNAPSLMTKKREHSVRINPHDAEVRGIADGARVSVRSPYGEVVTKARLTDEMMPGNAAMPHGWGHAGNWLHANASGGANSNLLANDDPVDTEKIAAMSIINGIPIQISSA